MFVENYNSTIAKVEFATIVCTTIASISIFQVCNDSSFASDDGEDLINELGRYHHYLSSYSRKVHVANISYKKIQEHWKDY